MKKKQQANPPTSGHWAWEIFIGVSEGDCAREKKTIETPK